MFNDELESRLQTFALGEPVSIDGESVYLRIDQDGAELGAYFLESPTGRQLQDALQLGFQSALEFDAGWALSDDGSVLLLTQSLPDVQGWADVPEALERLLSQIELLRTLFNMKSARTGDGASRDERRFRSKLMKGK